MNLFYVISLCFQLYFVYLFVHEHIDDGVVNRCCFGEERWDSCQSRVQMNAGMGRDHHGENSVRSPGHHKCHDHHDHHTGHLTFRFPGITQPALTVRHLHMCGRVLTTHIFIPNTS